MELIDTARLMQEARTKATAATFKEMGPSYLYNALQDRQPLLVIEIREVAQYEAMHVRASVNVSCDATEYLNGIMSEAVRVVVLSQGPGWGIQGNMMEVLKVTDMQKHSLVKKVFLLTGGFEAFYGQYPQMCLPSSAGAPAKAFAETRWPTEIMKGVLYMGSAFNLMVSAYAEALGIKTVIQVAPPLSTFAAAQYHYNPINKAADLANVFALIQAAPKPVLIIDLNGDKEAAAVSAVFFSKAKQLNSQLGLTYVLSKRPDVTLPSWLSLAVLNFGDEADDSEQKVMTEQMLRSLTS